MGYVYILSNPAMPGLVKIGRSDDVERRRYELSISTGVPKPYVIEAVYLFTDAKRAEEDLHEYLSEYRIENWDRKRAPEFFHLNKHDAREKVRRWIIMNNDDHWEQFFRYKLFGSIAVCASTLWQSRKDHIYTDFQRLVDDTKYDGTSRYPGKRQEYVNDVIKTCEIISNQFSCHGLFHVVILGEWFNLFMDVFSNHYTIHFGLMFPIGATSSSQMHGDAFPLLFEINCERNSHDFHELIENYNELVTFICRRIQFEEDEIIRQAEASLRSG